MTDQQFLLEQEYDMEMRSIDMGIARYRELKSRTDPSLMTPEQRIISRNLSALVPAIEAVQIQAAQGTPMKGVKKWGIPFLSLEADKLALITLATVFNNAHTSAACVSMSQKIASACHVERTYARLKHEAPDVWAWLKKYRKMPDRWSVRNAKKRAGMADESWDRTVRVYLGAKLLELAITHCDCVQLATRKLACGNMCNVVVIPWEIQKELESGHSNCELLTPFYLPMVVEPKPWEQGQGGYHWHQHTLFKYTGRNTTPSVDLTGCEQLKQAVNLLQSVPLAVDEDNLRVVQQAWTAGGGLGGLPTAEPKPLPPKPADMDTNEEAKARWKAAAAAVYDENVETSAKRAGVQMKLWISHKFKYYGALYFPYQLDWRGRAYPLPLHLHPQGDDVSRGLLRYAEPRPLGDHGLYWLMVHMANCWGQDKIPFRDRVQWSEMNTHILRQVVNDPYEHRFWCEADDPYQALAAAREYIWAIDSENPETYQSYQIIRVDGSCNGLQHFSALGRDPVGAKATNLSYSDTPQDIYSQVAEACQRRIITDMESEDPTVRQWATAWNGHVTRAVVKRGVMTTPYGVTKQGIRNQLVSDGFCKDIGDSPYAAADYLKWVIYDCVGEVVVAARLYMDWLRDVATLSSDLNHSLSWTVPTGLTVCQQYLESHTKNIYTTLQRMQIHEPSPHRVISTNKQKSSLPPNYIHSLDAAHMMLTVNAAQVGGIDDMVTIHDSYGSHACNIPTLRTIISQQFVDMHRTPLLDVFKAEVESQLDTELPDLPPYGDFDLEEVNRSDYFFH